MRSLAPYCRRKSDMQDDRSADCRKSGAWRRKVCAGRRQSASGALSKRSACRRRMAMRRLACRSLDHLRPGGWSFVFPCRPSASSFRDAAARRRRSSAGRAPAWRGQACSLPRFDVHDRFLPPCPVPGWRGSSLSARAVLRQDPVQASRRSRRRPCPAGMERLV